MRSLATAPAQLVDEDADGVRLADDAGQLAQGLAHQTGLQAMEICEALVRSGAIDAVVVDSVAAMVPRAAG